MNRSLRFGTALSALLVAGALAGCATGPKQSLQASKASASKVGLAMRAQVALAAGNFASAVSFAEQAVEHSPNEAAFRAVLGNAYFGAGRFASAESAYRDSLSLTPGQPNVILKLALAEIAQGKNAQALADLEVARDYLEAADYGLAVALAGKPADAVAVLGQVARLPGADARVRQNLALSLVLSGDWTMARTIAAQDVSPDQLDSRIQQWMAMATPTRASDQVAAITGITPSVDPGQPVRLALNKAQPAVRMAEAAPPAPPAPVSPAPLPVQYAAPEPEPVHYVEPRPRAKAPPVVAELPQAPEPQVPTIAEAVHAVDLAPQAEEPPVTRALLQPAVQVASAPVAPLPTRFEEKPDVAQYVAAKPRKAARASGRSNSVLQLGAYGSPERVAAAWDQVARRFGSLNRYTPVSARFSSSKGIVYRLSVKEFTSAGEAQQLCSALQQKGKNCFVRRTAGDAPVRLASR
ncbi:MAG: tetratricopeptide repeat protein [Sphingomicrobium sp.]